MTSPRSNPSPLIDPVERALLRRLVNGDGAAWREFVERYQGVVFAGVRRAAEEGRLAYATADLEDVTANVFASLVARDFSALRRFQGRSRLSTWLTVLARRHWLRYTRRKRFSRVERVDALASLVSDDAGDPIGELIRAEERSQLRRAMTQLSKDDREALTLFYQQRLDYAEIGRRLGIVENSVGPRIHRARKRLQRLIADGGNTNATERTSTPDAGDGNKTPPCTKIVRTS